MKGEARNLLQLSFCSKCRAHILVRLFIGYSEINFECHGNLRNLTQEREVETPEMRRLHADIKQGASIQCSISLKLLQKAQVVRPEIADIRDAVAQHGDALGAHAGRETGIDRRVIAAVLQHHRVHHAAAHDL